MTQQQSKQGLGTGYESSAFTKNIPSPKVTVASTAGIYYRNNVPWSRVAVHNKWQYATIGSTQQLAVHNKCLYATSGSTQQLAVHNKCQYATSGSTQVDNRSGSEDCVTWAGRCCKTPLRRDATATTRIPLRGSSRFRPRFLYYWSYRAGILLTFVKREKTNLLFLENFRFFW